MIREFFELEKQAIFRSSWQIVCHLSDVPRPATITASISSASRSSSCAARTAKCAAFTTSAGTAPRGCSKGPRATAASASPAATTPGPTRSTAASSAFRSAMQFKGLDVGRHGLAPLELEIFMGFIFVRFAPGLAERARDGGALRPRACGLSDGGARSARARLAARRATVNWKNVADNFSDGLHITVAHPGLTRLFGQSYGIEAQPWIDKMWGTLRDVPSSQLVRAAVSEDYCRRLSTCRPSGSGCGPISSCGRTSLSTSIPTRSTSCSSCRSRRPRRWFARSPTCIRMIGARCASARYLNWRINRRVSLEDKMLIERVQAGMTSSSYTVGPLSDNEVCLRSFARRMRSLIPESRLCHKKHRRADHRRRPQRARVRRVSRRRGPEGHGARAAWRRGRRRGDRGVLSGLSQFGRRVHGLALNPKVIRDLELPKFGLRVVERKLANFLPTEDGRYLKIGEGVTQAEVAKFSQRGRRAPRGLWAQARGGRRRAARHRSRDAAQRRGRKLAHARCRSSCTRRASAAGCASST